MTDLPIVEPGAYPDVPEVDYHADPVKGGSLSQSGAKVLLDCPAKYRWQIDNPSQTSDAQHIGSAAHKLVLGVGPEVEVIDAPDWKKKDAQQAKKDAEAAGKIPILTHKWEAVQDMCEALKNHKIAMALLDPDHGEAEQTMVWEDPHTGVTCRARVDWLRRAPGARTFNVDFKTSKSARPGAFAKSAADYGYHIQDEFYLDGIQALELGGPDAASVFIVQEKEPPYIVEVYELDAEAKRFARFQIRKARETYRRCMETGEWPGYSDGTEIELLSLPAWATRTY